MSKHTETPKARYTNFYLTMLIVSAAMTALILPSFIDTFRLVGYYTTAPLFVILMAIDYALLIVSIAGLILLFQKRQLGIVLTLGSYIAGFLLLIPMFFYVDQMVAYTLTSMSAADIRDSGGKEVASTFLSVFFYGAFVFAALLTPPIVFLWHYAWQKQKIADHKSTKDL